MGSGEGSHETQSFGALLRTLRHAANLTQEELAERAGLSVHAVTTLERGVRRAPRTTTVEQLAAALDLDPSQRTALAVAARDAAPRPPEPRSGVPPDPVAHFAGREAELAWLRRTLGETGRATVHGLGGVGKTQLVARYVRDAVPDYPDGVFWVRADRESSLTGDLASLAWRLRLPEREERQVERQIEAVLRWLREHGRWLLVLDNVEPATRDAVQRWLPPGLPGHLLQTSRAALGPARLRLEPLPHDVAERFLLRRTGEDDAESARLVAETLGCLPLALEQAGAYVEAGGRDLAGYARLVRTRLVELMAEGRPDDYPLPVANTWRVSFDQLEAERPAAADLLRLCAFLAPDDVPAGALTAGAGSMPEPLRAALTDEIEVDRIVSALRNYSLLERRGDGLHVHRLVQAVVRESLGAAEREAWLAAAIGLLRTVFPDEVDQRPERWPACARLVPHVEAVARLVTEPRSESTELAALLDRAGSYLWTRCEWARARPFLERALAIRERALGPDHAETSDSLNNLALTLAHLVPLSEVLPLLRRSAAIRERVLGGDHPATIGTINNLARLLTNTGEQSEARPLLERVAAASERALGPDHPRTALSLNNLALVLRDQGDLDAALPLFERALAISERTQGRDHPSTAVCLNNVGAVLHRLGDLDAARRHHERALSIRERILGADHPRTAASLHNLAMVANDQGDHATALTLGRRALDTMERVLGPQHPRTVACRAAMVRMSASVTG